MNGVKTMMGYLIVYPDGSCLIATDEVISEMLLNKNDQKPDNMYTDVAIIRFKNLSPEDLFEAGIEFLNHNASGSFESWEDWENWEDVAIIKEETLQ